MRRTIEIPDDLYQEIKEIADIRDRSIAWTMRHLINTNNELVGYRAMKSVGHAVSVSGFTPKKEDL